MIIFLEIMRASYKITILCKMIIIYIYNSIVSLKITQIILKILKICETKLLSNIQNIYTLLICSTTSFLWIAREFYYLKLFSLDMYKIINKHQWLNQVGSVRHITQLTILVVNQSANFYMERLCTQTDATGNRIDRGIKLGTNKQWYTIFLQHRSSQQELFI